MWFFALKFKTKVNCSKILFSKWIFGKQLRWRKIAYSSPYRQLPEKLNITKKLVNELKEMAVMWYQCHQDADCLSRYPAGEPDKSDDKFEEQVSKWW